MPYIKRNEQGAVQGVFAQLQPGVAEDFVEDGAPDSTLPPSLQVLENIAKVERENPITHRALRELILALGELYPAAKSTPFYVRSKTADDLIKVERAKLS